MNITLIRNLLCLNIIVAINIVKLRIFEGSECLFGKTLKKYNKHFVLLLFYKFKLLYICDSMNKRTDIYTITSPATAPVTGSAVLSVAYRAFRPVRG